MKALCETLGVARSNIVARATGTLSRARVRPPLPDADLVAQIKAVIEEIPPMGIGAFMPFCGARPVNRGGHGRAPKVFIA